MIKNLQIKHNREIEILINKLQSASINFDEVKDTTSTNILEIGDLVTILNPSKHRDCTGTVVRIGVRVTVEITQGKVVRIRINLSKE